MLRPRIIPCLLIQNGGLVKTRRFKEPKYVGDPINAVRIFNQKEVDELVVVDIDASKKGTGPNFELISMLASECFMPLTYIGGIQSLNDAKKIMALGVEKIGINSANFSDLTLVKQIATHFGNQAVLACVDVKKTLFGAYKVFHHVNGELKTNLEAHIKDCTDSGAGEILLQSVDNDGMRQGFDLELITRISQFLEVPLIALGGAGQFNDLLEGLDAGADAVSAGSLFTFYGKHRAVLITYPDPKELTNLYKSMAEKK